MPKKYGVIALSAKPYVYCVDLIQNKDELNEDKLGEIEEIVKSSDMA